MLRNFSMSGARKSVAGVLSAFNKTLDDLREVERMNQAEAVNQARLIEEARTKHDEAIQEAALASEVSAKIVELISPTLNQISAGELVALTQEAK